MGAPKDESGSGSGEGSGDDEAVPPVVAIKPPVLSGPVAINPNMMQGGIDIPLAFRLAYQTISNVETDLSIFKTQVREDAAYAFNVTKDRFAVSALAPSFNAKYITATLTVYPGETGNEPTTDEIVDNLREQIKDETSSLRLGIATRHLFIPGAQYTQPQSAIYAPLGEEDAAARNAALSLHSLSPVFLLLLCLLPAVVYP